MQCVYVKKKAADRFMYVSVCVCACVCVLGDRQTKTKHSNRSTDNGMMRKIK